MTTRTRITRAAAAAIAAAGVTAGLAVSTPAVASAAPCGFYTEMGRHLYNHCGTGSVQINIHWDNFLGPDRNEVRCVGPGITQIGVPTPSNLIDAAWYIGNC